MVLFVEQPSLHQVCYTNLDYQRFKYGGKLTASFFSNIVLGNLWLFTLKGYSPPWVISPIWPRLNGPHLLQCERCERADLFIHGQLMRAFDQYKLAQSRGDSPEYRTARPSTTVELWRRRVERVDTWRVHKDMLKQFCCTVSTAKQQNVS